MAIASRATLRVITNTRSRQPRWRLIGAPTAVLVAAAVGVLLASLSGGGLPPGATPRAIPQTNSAPPANLMPCFRSVGKPGAGCPESAGTEVLAANLGHYAIFISLENSTLTFAEHVPGGVRTATLRFAAHRAHTISARVVSNVVVVRVRGRAHALPTTLTWGGQHGRIIRTIALR